MAKKLTDREQAALTAHGFPWDSGYWPTIRIENGYTPSCANVETAEILRSATVKLGIGYFDGNKTIGRSA